MLGKPAQQQEVQTNEEKEITGIVSDATGPMPGAIVVVKGTQRGIATDFDGKYSIKAKEGETLVFSFMGMEDVLKVVGESNLINIALKDSNFVTSGVMVTVTKRRNFFGRTFHKIGNWFK